MSESRVIERATAALAAGEWKTARACFEQILSEQESPDALMGLGTALLWLGETDAAVAAQERAYVGFRRSGDALSAALAAMSVCQTYGASLGNHSAAQGWIGRFARLVEQYDLTSMRGWLPLLRAVHANEFADPVDAEAHAREALDAAHRSADIDLELCALSELGSALVQVGRIGEGAALMDEAMAGALGGEAHSLQTVVFTGCRSIVSCGRALEFERAAQWIRAADEFTRRYGNLHLYTTCRTQYGCMLFCQGQWDDAERELRTALRIGKTAERRLYVEALAKLSELRVAQGRLEEAEELLRGFEDHVVAAYPIAEIQLRRGEPELAAGLLRRRLEVFRSECLEAAPLAELAVEAELAAGNLPAAIDRATWLAEVGGQSSCPLIVARGRRAVGRTALASGDSAMAVEHLSHALDVFTGLETPLEAARTHFLLARALAEQDAATAAAEARAAYLTFESLGAAVDADQAAAFLRSLGAKVVRRRAAPATTLSRREQEVLALLSEGLSNYKIAERLFLSRKTVEHHLRSLFVKLGVANRAEAAAYGVRHRARDM